MLRDVEALLLVLRIGADPERHLEEQEDQERDGEREGAYRAETEGLRPELMEENSPIAPREEAATLAEIQEPVKW